MVTWFLTFIVATLILSAIVLNLEVDSYEFAVSIAILISGLIAFVVPIGIGNMISYPKTINQPMISIYENQAGDQIYLKSLPGSKLVYWLMEDGVPREQTFLAKNVKQVVIEDGKPYVETTKFLFAQEWYKYFAFSSKRDIVVFHVPQTGVENDINNLLIK